MENLDKQILKIVLCDFVHKCYLVYGSLSGLKTRTYVVNAYGRMKHGFM